MVLAHTVKGAKIKPAIQINTETPARNPAALRSADTVSSDKGTASLGPLQATSGKPSYREISFQELSAFPIMVAEEVVDHDSTAGFLQVTRQIPSNVRAFNGDYIAMQGFMLPTKAVDGKVTEFLLLKNQGMCCYGTVPQINEWVNVHAAGKGVKLVMDVPVTISGTFRVGPVRESGSLAGIYELDLDQMREISK
jgi:hypothetical protein